MTAMTKDHVMNRPASAALAVVAAVLLLVCVSGCADKLETLTSDPVKLLEDPHFAAYQTDAGDLEHQYLQKDIDYAEYRRRKAALDQKYDQEVAERERILGGQDSFEASF